MDSPIVAATWQAGLLSALSNVLAQLITCWRSQTSWQINSVSLFQFVLFSVLACPPNYIWQSWLEERFPAYGEAQASLEKEAIVDRSVPGKKDKSASNRLNSGDEGALVKEASNAGEEKASQSLNKMNTAIKFTLDQTLGAAVNTVLFIAGIGLIRGQPWSTIDADVRAQFWPMILAGQKLWPLVSILCFTLVPVEYRMLVGSTAGLFWGIYLSLLTGSEE